MYTKNHRNHSTSTAKHFNMIQFLEKYYNNPEEQRKTLIKMRFPQGFVCPDCGCTEYRWLSTRSCMQCKRCSRHIHILAGTALQDCRLSFFQILLGIYLFISEQSGINGVSLANQMGVNVNTARLFLRKLRAACSIGNEETILKGSVELDCAYIGGVDQGGKRGLGSDKQTVAVSVEICEVENKKGKKTRFPRQS